MRRIWPVAARQKRVFALSVAAGLIATGVTVAVPVVIGRGVDAAAADEPLRGWVIALCVLAVARACFGFAYRYGLFRSAHRIEADLRMLVFERLTELSFSYWDRTQSGQVISRANSDVRSIQLLFAFGPIVAMQLVLLVVGTAAMLLISVQLTLVAMAPLPLVLWVGIRLRDRVFPLSWVTQARMAELATITDESIQGAQIVRAFAQEHNQVTLLARTAQRLRWAGVATADARARHAPIMEALPRLGLALVLLNGGLLAINGSVDVGDVVAFNAFVLIMAAPFRMIGFVLIQWQRASAAAQRVFEILDERPEIVDPADARELIPDGSAKTRHTQPDNPPAARERAWLQGRVDFEDVVFSYPFGGGHRVLDGLTFTVAEGETVAVVGRTASGKSTIARLMPRFYDVDAGMVRVDGIDVRDLRLSGVFGLRRAVTVVTDEPFLFASSVRDNVAFACPDADEQAVRQALTDAAADFVDAMPQGIHSLLGERGATISGGQRQRLALARALIADPAVLVLDDATSAIDAEIEARILAALRARRAGRTTILIAHRLSTIAAADRVLFIAGGKVAASGSHLDLLRSTPEYAAALTDITDTRRDDHARAPTDSSRHKDAPVPEVSTPLGSVEFQQAATPLEAHEMPR